MQPQAQGKAVLFDFDGTLGRSLPSWTHAYQEALREVGVELEVRAVRAACFSMRGTDVQREFAIPDLAAFSEGVWRRMLSNMPSVEMYPHLAETLNDLALSSFRLAVVTNSRRSHVAPVLERWAVGGMFSSLVAIDDVKKGKPHPEAIERALEELRVPPARAWMVGDSPADIEAGRAAGVKTVAFSPEENHDYFRTTDLRNLNPTHVVHSLAELKRLVLELDAGE